MFDELTKTPLRERGNLSDSIYAALRDWIADGSLQPGHRLRETEIAQYFEVSNTPVREALQRLEYDGLVKSSPRRGASVASVEWAEIHSILVVRELLEVYAVKRVAQTSSIQDFTEVREILRMQAEVAERGDSQEFSRLDRDFHMAIIRMTGNSPLVKFTELAHMHLQQARSRATALQNRGTARSLQEHENVLRAIEAGDVEKAEAAINIHVQSAMTYIAALMEEDGANDAAAEAVD